MFLSLRIVRGILESRKLSLKVYFNIILQNADDN